MAVEYDANVEVVWVTVMGYGTGYNTRYGLEDDDEPPGFSIGDADELDVCVSDRSPEGRRE